MASMKEPNLKGLGLRQNQLIYKMGKESLVIRVIYDWYDNSRERRLEDEDGDDWLEDVPEWLFVSLAERGLFTYQGFKPSLRITVETYRLKKKILEMLNIVPEVQVSDTTRTRIELKLET